MLPPSWQPGDPLPDLAAAIDNSWRSGSTLLSASILAAAYGLPPTAQANGKIVAVLDTPDNHALTDLALYRKMQGLPAMEACSGLPAGTGIACFAQVAEDGSPSTNTDSSAGADGETSLDIDMVSLACPDCSILLVELNPNLCESDLLEGVATAAKLGASAISISFAGPEATDPNAISLAAGGAEDGTTGCPDEANWTHDAQGPFSTPGHLVLASSGDYAYDDELYRFTPSVRGAAPNYPASSPNVMAVGGTALYWSGSSSGEGVWENTTSGCSTEFAVPPWQAPLVSGSSCNGRATVDVSAMAEFFSDGVELGIDAVVNGQTLITDGTSASSPLVAGIFTRLGLTTEISIDPSWVYENSSAFNDIGSPSYPVPSGASNTNAPKGSFCGILCISGTGWDGPSGVGSPNGTRLAALPLRTASPPPDPDVGSGPRGCACAVGSRGRPSGVTCASVVFWMAFFGVLRRALLVSAFRRRLRLRMRFIATLTASHSEDSGSRSTLFGREGPSEEAQHT